ncbi:HAD family hydrolase [bacterium D16-50]|nr:HAD family hydrolase [bacterium D16-50]
MYRKEGLFCKAGIIANQSLGSEERLKKFGIWKYIDILVASAEEGIAKPDKRIFETALTRAGCKPEEAAMVGDRLDNDIIHIVKLDDSRQSAFLI